MSARTPVGQDALREAARAAYAAWFKAGNDWSSLNEAMERLDAALTSRAGDLLQLTLEGPGLAPLTMTLTGPMQFAYGATKVVVKRVSGAPE